MNYVDKISSKWVLESSLRALPKYDIISTQNEATKICGKCRIWAYKFDPGTVSPKYRWDAPRFWVNVRLEHKTSPTVTWRPAMSQSFPESIPSPRRTKGSPCERRCCLKTRYAGGDTHTQSERKAADAYNKPRHSPRAALVVATAS